MPPRPTAFQIVRVASFCVVHYRRCMTEKALLELTASIVAAVLKKNRVSSHDLATLISSVYGALAKLQAPTAETIAALVPAVSVRSSVKPESITCLECGADQKALRRHLGTAHDLTPEQYRAKWSLTADYPMVAPNSTAERSRASIARGFGRKR